MILIKQISKVLLAILLITRNEAHNYLLRMILIDLFDNNIQNEIIYFNKIFYIYLCFFYFFVFLGVRVWVEPRFG
jgi:hypothetical protein